MKAVLSIPVSKDDGEVRVDRWFRRHFPKLTQGQIEKLVRTGQVRVDGARVKAADRITPGQIVRVPPLPEAAPRGEATGVKGKDAVVVEEALIHTRSAGAQWHGVGGQFEGVAMPVKHLMGRREGR